MGKQGTGGCKKREVNKAGRREKLWAVKRQTAAIEVSAPSVKEERGTEFFFCRARDGRKRRRRLGGQKKDRRLQLSI